MSERRLGVYVCNCGGNISDYVDVERVVDAVQGEQGVVVARRAMFTCSDATQQEIETDIREQRLDGLVVASCSPKLHTFTFREVARRAGLNPYEYTQVNIREQCSWTHTDDPEGATEKAIRLVRAGIARTRLSEPLEPLVVETTSRVLVIGGGVAGLRAAAGLADIGLSVVLVEREPELGGWVGRLGPMFPDETDGRRLVDRLKRAVAHRDVTVFTNAELVEKSGVYGNYRAKIRVQGERPETIEVEIGSIVVTTGADAYLPEIGELGYGIDGVLTLPEFRALLDEGEGPLVQGGRPVESIAYVYCVGSRNAQHPACSRYCCTAAVHASLLASGRGGAIRQYHLYRDLRTYGKNELLATRSRREGSLYLRFPDDEPPEVARSDDGRLAVSVRDLLTGGEHLTIAADLVVLVTGLVPRRNEDLVSVLKLPVGTDGFFNEIHPKLRPVETVVDGVLVAGACQGPKTSSESVASALAAVTQSGAVLKQGSASLDPQVAVIDVARCTGCGACSTSCPFAAIDQVVVDGRSVAAVLPASCKGCGGCVPVCPEDAIDLLGYSDAQVRAAIDALAVDVVA